MLVKRYNHRIIQWEERYLGIDYPAVMEREFEELKPRAVLGRSEIIRPATKLSHQIHPTFATPTV
jgi:hypothetical protein